MFWRPISSPARYVLLILPLLTIGVAVWLWVMLNESASIEGYGPYTFLYGLAFALSLVLTALLAYLAWCANSIQYRLDKANLTLRYGPTRHIIPLTSIKRLYAPGEKVDGSPVVVRWRSLADTIPGYLVGWGESRQLGRVVAIATTPAPQQVFIVTHDTAFGISPRRSLAFIEEIAKRVKAAAQPDAKRSADEADTRPRTRLNKALSWGASLWNDRPARWLLLSGLLACTLFFGYMSLVYANLPPILPLHWNSQAQVDRVGDPQELLRLPVIALGIWLLNALIAAWARPRERAATLFLLAAAIAAPIVFAAGALSIVLKTT